MPRTSYGQRWGTRASSSTSDEDRPDYEDDLSELSELSDSDYTPDTDVEAPVESDDYCLEDLEEHEFKVCKLGWLCTAAVAGSAHDPCFGHSYERTFW